MEIKIIKLWVNPIKLLLEPEQMYREDQNRKQPPLLDSTDISLLFSLWSNFYTFTRVAIFPDKCISLHSITFITTILVESFRTGYTPFWLKLETHNFTFWIHFYTNQEKPKRFSSRKLWIFFTRLISCYYFDFIRLLSFCNSVSCDFHCLILCKQTSYIIIIKVLTAIMPYNFIHKKL